MSQPTGHRDRAAGGFTLIELLTTIAVAAVMMAIAAPSFVKFQKNSQLTATANSFVAALSAARAEAMKRQLNTFVKPGDGTLSDWALGWTVFVDGDWDNALTTTSGSSDVTVLVQAALPSGITISNNTTVGSSGLTGGYVMFNGAGFAQTTGYATTGVLSLQFSNGTEQRNVLISPAGRIRVCKPDSTTCTTSNAF